MEWELTFRQSACAREEQFALARVAREGGGTLELRARLLDAPEFGEKVAPHARQKVIALERRLVLQLVYKLKAGVGAERQRDRDRAVQLHYGRRHKFGERVVERHDARPVGLLCCARSCMAGGDGGLQSVRAERAPSHFVAGGGRGG